MNDFVLASGVLILIWHHKAVNMVVETWWLRFPLGIYIAQVDIYLGKMGS